MIENENKIININEENFYSGKIDKKNKEKAHVRLYRDFIRKIYVCSKDNRQHKQLSYFFKIIQYINYNTNIVSFTPTEIEGKAIKPMTIGDFCDVVHYERKKARQLFQSLSKIQINGQRLLGFVTSDWNKRKYNIIVNPDIYYGGKNKSDVLRAFNNQAKFSLPENKD